jgi:copper chaperone
MMSFQKEETMKSITIKGMSCQHCVMAVTKALNGLDGITDVKVELESGKATFEETKPVAMEIIVAAIRKAGYDVA